MDLKDQLIQDRNEFIYLLHKERKYTDEQLSIIFNMHPIDIAQIIDSEYLNSLKTCSICDKKVKYYQYTKDYVNNKIICLSCEDKHYRK